MRRVAWLVALSLTFLAIVPTPASSQVGGLRKKAEDAKKALELQKAMADSAKAQAAADSAKGANNAAPAPTASTTPATGAAPPRADPKIWENYDFVPGSKVIFYTDFSDDKVGNFARGLKWQGGPLDVVDRDGVKMLRSTGRSTFLIPVGKHLPQRFTLEIDVMAPHDNCCGYEVMAFEGGAAMDRGPKSAEIVWHPSGELRIDAWRS